MVPESLTHFLGEPDTAASSALGDLAVVLREEGQKASCVVFMVEVGRSDDMDNNRNCDVLLDDDEVMTSVRSLD